MRVKFIRDHELYRKGQIIVADKQQAKLLIKLGVAVISKDMTIDDIKVT